MVNNILNKLNMFFTNEEVNEILKFINNDIKTELSILEKKAFSDRLYSKEILGFNNNLIEKPIALLFNKEAKIGKLEIIENNEMERFNLIKSQFNEEKKCCYILDKITNGLKVREILVYIP